MTLLRAQPAARQASAPRSRDAAARSDDLDRWESEAILLGATDRVTLIRLASALSDWLDSAPPFALKDLAYTLNVGQPHFPARLGLVATTGDDLGAKLRSAARRLGDPSIGSIRDAGGVYYWDEPVGREGPMAFLFPGEGSQYPGMLADLSPHFPEVRSLFETADRVAIERGHSRLPSEQLTGSDPAGGPALWAMGTAINVVLTSQWALYQLLIRLGLRPSAVVGHSSGEFLALGASGVLRIDRRFEDGIGALGSVFEALGDSGEIPSAALLAIAAGRERVAEILSAADLPGVSIAVDNCPHQVVVAGPPAEIDRAAEILGRSGLFCDRLPIDRAYHTPGFEAAVGPVRAFLDGLRFRGPRIPIYSCSIAGRMPPDPEQIRRLAAGQWSRPVAFRETVEAMHADGVRLFVEAGARGNLTGFVDDILRGRRAFAVAANLPRRSGPSQINHLVASLYAQGVAIRPDHLYERRRPLRLRLDEPASPAASGRPDSIGPGATSAAGPVVEAVGIGSPSVGPEEGAWGDDPAIRAFRRTMEEFRITQEGVLSAYLAASRPPEIGPVGPWVGEVVSITPGRELVARRRLVIEGDPVAENHTLGGRRVSAVDPGLKGLPVVPFAVMAETLAQAASLLRPGRVVVGLEDVTALRWVRYEEDRPVVLEIAAIRDADRPDSVRVRIADLGAAGDGRVAVFEGVVRFAEARTEPPGAPDFRPENAEKCRFEADELYDDQWLFHGPAMRALARVGGSSPSGIEGSIAILPRRGLLPPGCPGTLLTDAVTIDVFTHLLGCWGLDRLVGGDVIFPLRLGRLEILGDDPGEGVEVSCRIWVKSVDPRRVRVDADFVRPDGSTWMRMTDWEDWRFHWPDRYRDVFRAPDRVFVGEPLELADAPPGTSAVWLEPPADFGRPIWRDVLEWTQLGPEERRAHLALGGDESYRSLRLWGRIAAKEAARQLGIDRGSPPTYPADLAVGHDADGRPSLRRSNGSQRPPNISIAHAGGVAVALATADPRIAPGIDVVPVESRGERFESIAFSASERSLLDRVGAADRDEWAARFWCAKEAAGKAMGTGLGGRPMEMRVIDVGPDAGIWVVSNGGRAPLRVRAGRRGGYVWGWTLEGGNA